MTTIIISTRYRFRGARSAMTSIRMTQLCVHIPPQFPAERVAAVVDAAVQQMSLDIVSRGTLKTYPGSVHWHTKRDTESGTLEITWWPQRRRLWLKVQRGRTAKWIDEAMPQLKAQLEQALHRDVFR